MAIKKRHIWRELEMRIRERQRITIFLSLRETLTVFGLRHSIIVIFRMRGSKQREDKRQYIVHLPESGVLFRLVLCHTVRVLRVCNKGCPFALSPKLITRDTLIISPSMNKRAA